MIRVGFIGYRNHAARLMDLLVKIKEVSIDAVFHPKRLPPHPKGTTRLADLENMDAIFIVSPNDTHYAYLQHFSENSAGYIFCEKPVVSSKEQMLSLNLNTGRTFFNFNYRFSRLADVIENGLVDGSLGTPIQMSVCTAQGLAFKPEYKNSWRADAQRHLNGIAETKAIHHVDLAFYLFGEATQSFYLPGNFSGHGTAHDSCQLSLQCGNGTMVNILASYAAPLTVNMQVLGTNGFVEYHDGSLNIASPRDIFDGNGFFTTPPRTLLVDYKSKPTDMYEESLERSVTYFLDVCRSGGTFPKELYNASLATTAFMLSLQEFDYINLPE